MFARRAGDECPFPIRTQGAVSTSCGGLPMKSYLGEGLVHLLLELGFRCVRGQQLAHWGLLLRRRDFGAVVDILCA